MIEETGEGSEDWGPDEPDARLPRVPIPEDVKRRIVVELARFRSSVEVSEMLREVYGLEIPARHLCHYDASKSYAVLGANLRRLFEETRRDFVEGVTGLHLAHQPYRLRQLDRILEYALAKGDLKLAAAMIEQGAKDHGGLYTSRHQAAAQAKAPPRAPRMSASEARARIAATLRKRGVRLLEPGEEGAPAPPAPAAPPGLPAPPAGGGEGGAAPPPPSPRPPADRAQGRWPDESAPG